jgi:hypothetical protein
VAGEGSKDGTTPKTEKFTGELPQLKRAAPNPRPLFSPVRVAKWTGLTILLLVRGQGKEQRPIFWEEM